MKKRGFTLIEILIVCTIIALLAAIVIVNLEKAQAKSRDVQRKAGLSQIAAALEMYKVDHKTYIPEIPAAGAHHGTVIANNANLPELISGNYIPSIPSDPGTNIYYYYSDATGSQFQVNVISETINVPATGTPNCSDPTALADAKLKAGEFYDPADPTTGHDCRKFQVSSSPTASLWE